MVPRHPHMPASDFAPGTSLTFHGTLPPEVSKDAIVYVLAVAVFYAAIIIVLVGTNLHRFRYRLPGDTTERNSKTESRRSRDKEMPVKKDSEVDPIMGTTDYILDLEENEKETVVLPLLSECLQVQNNCVELFTDQSSYIEAIEVSCTSKKKHIYSHTFIETSALRNVTNNKHHETIPIDVVQPKFTNFLKSLDHFRDNSESHPYSNDKADNRNVNSFNITNLSRSGNTGNYKHSTCETSEPKSSDDSHVSTTIVSNLSSESSAKKLQRVRVGFTSEEEIRPRGLLDMSGDDAGDPVSV